MAISVFVLKNLEKSEELIQIANKESQIKQLELSVEDINREIIDMFKKNGKKDLLDVPPLIPFDYGNIKVVLTIEEYNQRTYKFEKNTIKNLDEEFNYYVDRSRFLKFIEDKNITNQRQIDFIVDEYINEVDDTKILEIKDRLVYTDLNGSNNYAKCSYELEIDGLKASVKNMIFEMSNNYRIAQKPQIYILPSSFHH